MVRWLRAGCVVLLLAGGTDPVLARLGESLEVLQERFGQPVEDKLIPELQLRQLSFRNHDLMVGVTLIDGHSASEQYIRSTFKRDAAGKLILLPIPPALAGAILEANREQSTWSLVSEAGADEKKYLRGDKEAIALYKTEKDAIIEVRLSTSEFNRHVTRIAREKR